MQFTSHGDYDRARIGPNDITAQLAETLGRSSAVKGGGNFPRFRVLSTNTRIPFWVLAKSKNGEALKIVPQPSIDGAEVLGITRSEFASLKEKLDFSDEVESDEVEAFLLNSISA
jgi:hypothetical protein